MEVLKERGFAVSAIWSESNQKHPLSEEQQGIRRHIIEHREIPPDIDVLFINASCETCINIGNAEKTEYPIDFMIIHNSQSDVQTQVRGRYRNDLKTLYLYEPTEEIHKEQLTIPRKYLGIRLSREDIRRLISYLNLRDKKRELISSPLTGVTSNSWDTPAGHRVYDACRGFSVPWGSGASSASSVSC